MTRSNLVLAVAAAVYMSVVVMVVDGIHTRQEAAWQQRAASAVEQAKQEHIRTLAAERVAEAARVRADSLAERAARAAPVVRERIRVVRDSAPPDPARDEIIDTLVVESDTRQEAFQAASEAADTLRAALTASQATTDSLGAVLAARPRPRSPWLPSLGVGPIVGLCSDLRPCVGVGVALTWKVSF